MTAPNRRWFRFSLRTLFVVVTVVACWLGWTLRQIHRRDQLIDLISAQPDIVERSPILTIDAMSNQTLPLAWRLLGVNSVEHIERRHLGPLETELLQSAPEPLPEAVVLVYEVDGRVRCVASPSKVN